MLLLATKTTTLDTIKNENILALHTSLKTFTFHFPKFTSLVYDEEPLDKTIRGYAITWGEINTIREINTNGTTHATSTLPQSILIVNEQPLPKK